MITLYREPSYADSLRSYKVVIDGEVVAKIKHGETISLTPPAPGSHQIWVTIDWCRSNKLDFTYSDAPLNFVYSSSLKGMRLFLLYFYCFMPFKWCSIRQI